MKEKTHKIIRYTLSILVAGILVYFAFDGIDWKDFFHGLANTDWWYIILSMVAGGIALFFREERWRSQLLPLDSDTGRLKVWDGSNIGNFLNIVIPGVGEFYRCGFVTSRKATYDKVFGTILMERAWDIIAIFALLFMAMFGHNRTIAPFMRDHVLQPFSSRFNFSLWWLLAAFFVIVAVALWVICSEKDKNSFCFKIAKWLKGMLGGFVSFGKIRSKGLFLLYTVGIWFMYILVTYYTFLAIPGLDHLTLADAIFISAVGNIASVIPTPGNVGPYHYLVGLSISTIYLHSGEITAMAMLCATLSHGSHALLLILLGLESYICITLKKKKN